MRFLFIEGATSTRDVLSVAAQGFPDMEIEAVEFEHAMPEILEGDYDGLIVEDEPNSEAALGLLGTLAIQGSPLVTAVVADEQNVKLFLKDKKRLGIAGFLRKPLEALDVYRLLNRLADKVGSAERAEP